MVFFFGVFRSFIRHKLLIISFHLLTALTSPPAFSWEEEQSQVNFERMKINIRNTYPLFNYQEHSEGEIPIYLNYEKCEYSLSSIRHIAIASDNSFSKAVDWNDIRKGVSKFYIGGYSPKTREESFCLGYQVVSTFRKHPEWGPMIYWPESIQVKTPEGELLHYIEITISKDLGRFHISPVYE